MNNSFKISVKNGATFNPTTNTPSPSNGYFVFLPQYEQKVPLNSFKVECIEDYICRTKENRAEKTYIRACINENTVYLDIFIHILNKRTAIETAYKNNQLALYDACNGKVLELPTKQKNGTMTQQRAYLTSVIDRLCK